MKIKKTLKMLAYSSESFNISILFRVLIMLLRGWGIKIRTSTIKYPFFVGSRVRIIGPIRKLKIGKMVKIENDVVIQTYSKSDITICNKVTIGEGTKIRPSSYYGGELGEGIYIGNGSAIGVNSYLGCSGFIYIGDDVIIGPNFTAIAENHNFEDKNIPIKMQGVKRSAIKIADNVWIGCNVTILAGVEIGTGSVIAAGAVVTKSLPPGSLAAGIPARVIREIH
ncbi:MAG: acyltransferase [Aeromonas veronii]|uniref:Transferase hexapeptide (Six repeat-containing protein) n=1 Tax=Aeromonas veronii TaxID=654 RepID=A0A653KSQ8_AERVE|nr:acyltransferase [Aeromonas veronii]VXA82445.1 Transferase hexapeptide (Six repeat-containing protein) [Aeromonas veronii]